MAAPLAAQVTQLPAIRAVPPVPLDTAMPPVATRPTAYRPDALLPGSRIVAYYGNPLSTRMGILGEIPPEQMMARLDSVSRRWALADSTRVVRPALHLIVTVALGGPGADGKYRIRHSDSLIAKVARWAESRDWLLFLDLQVGQSNVADEVDRLLPWLARPYVHLGLDPEFAMPGGAIPGRRIGTLDAAAVNQAIDRLARLVDEHHLPPKVLVVHRFTEQMLTNHEQIKADPRVQVVIDMDGFGAPQLKRSIFGHVVERRPVQFAGIKLFYKNDSPMLTEAEVVAMRPIPLYIQYQ